MYARTSKAQSHRCTSTSRRAVVSDDGRRWRTSAGKLELRREEDRLLGTRKALGLAIRAGAAVDETGNFDQSIMRCTVEEVPFKAGASA